MIAFPAVAMSRPPVFPGDRALRILIVDDDDSVRSSLAEVLVASSERRLEVRAVPNAGEALAFFQAWMPDVVLLDLGLPDCDGWQLFELLEHARPFTACVVITAQPDQAPHACRLGIDALFEKPLNIPVFLETVERLLAESEPARAARIIARTLVSTTCASYPGGVGSSRGRP